MFRQLFLACVVLLISFSLFRGSASNAAGAATPQFTAQFHMTLNGHDLGAEVQVPLPSITFSTSTAPLTINAQPCPAGCATNATSNYCQSCSLN